MYPYYKFVYDYGKEEFEAIIIEKLGKNLTWNAHLQISTRIGTLLRLI